MNITPGVELWHTWTIRVLVIISLLTQVILSLLSHCRRQGGGKWFIRIPVWLIYLFADWVAIFAIGRILQVERSTDFQTLWAPFLLLHLGGPDTITSFSLEDNEFWLRHLFGLLLQVLSTLYVIGKSLPHNMFLFPTFLVLIAGTIKYAERNLSFYLASKDRFGDKNGVDSNSSSESASKVSWWKQMLKVSWWKKMLKVSWWKKMLKVSWWKQMLKVSWWKKILKVSWWKKMLKVSGWKQMLKVSWWKKMLKDSWWKTMIMYWFFCEPYPAQFHTPGADDSYLEEGWRYVRNGTLLSSFFMRKEPYGGTIKFLWVGPLISPHRRELSRICFLRKSSMDILHMIEVELSLLYEALHTKFPLLESKPGIILRAVGSSCIVVAFLSFTVLHNKHGGEEDSHSRKLDACLTYALLISAITIDFISIIVVSFSDFHKFQPHWKFEKYLMCSDQAHDENVMIINRRKCWSREVPQLCFVTYYVGADHTIWSNKFSDFPNLRITLGDMLRPRKYLSSKKLLEDHVFWSFIVQELKEKAERAETVEEGKKLCLRKGEGPILQWFNVDDEQGLRKQKQTETKLIRNFWNLNYTESFLAWHIATELCFLYEEEKDITMGYRSMSKVISCYMFYLFETQDPLTAGVFIDSKVLREGSCNHMQLALKKYTESLKKYKPRRSTWEDGSTRILYTDINDNNAEKNVYEQGRDNVHGRDGVSKSEKLFAIDKHYFAETAPPKTALENARKLVDELEQEQKEKRKQEQELRGTFPWGIDEQSLDRNNVLCGY